ncbi:MULTISPECIES: helix-turn-helix domain-containing protein [Pseudonocardia]|uniref:Helix-turn-helix domain protein n=2 Tax=Pseudonocardia TaxID=1847 RepID=A0A1Y2N3X5_PSEAH|nr:MULTISPECIES: helix-turn-helix domain-containing protein [Pseudonocardia]OSY42184.1 Helix-turn-helix domain protein [Pseudonocardia autotrophica]TDN75048.1 excisionase family DNA binding protein [Pseudonocardia autotrophica]BBF98992.1 excisionase [Pseudonocardia autotrophica]GEC23912.1 excisionase [Pseudonocardia saturnea]
MTDDRTAQIGQLLAQLATLMADQPAPREPEATPRPNRVLLTVGEAADQLGIGKTTAYAYVRTGELESVLIGRLRRIHADAIAEFAARLVAKHRAA